MIHLTGSAHRSFLFPADVSATSTYFGNLERVLGLLPHITLVKRYGADQFRALYHTTELGLYRVRIYCDLEAHLDSDQALLHVLPLTAHPAVKARATLNSLTAPGVYTSTSHFLAEGTHTRVEYRLRLRATLPTPLGLNLVPQSVLEQITRNITQWRIREIADGLVERSIKDFARRSKKRR